jgi:alkanesulfonate monooxygenase SsuD/methylene tetrahydromethanopterin reductase-like flavin-dependent oxidoreductase (luciferase family)
MNVSLQIIFQNYGGALPDAEHVAFETDVALAAEPLGFDKVFVVEHHFTDYAACPDNAQFLSYLAAKTSRVKLGSGAFILPWNTPLRVAEKITLLDHLSGGRAVLGLGRGLARREYDGFGIAMAESRDRFDEAARMILDATDRGWIEGEGPYYPQAADGDPPASAARLPRSAVRDRDVARSRSSRRHGSARVSRSSRRCRGRCGRAPSLASYRTVWASCQEGPPPPPLTCDLLYCAPTDAEAEETARVHMAEYYLSVLDHYELLSKNFEGVRGYEMYQQASAILSSIGKEDQAQGYLTVQSWGSPEKILRSLAQRREIIGDFELSVIARYGALSREKVMRSLELFGKEVIPELRGW